MNKVKVCVVNPDYYRSSGVTIAIRRIFEGVSPLGVEQYFVDCGYGKQENSTEWIPQERMAQFGLMANNPFVLVVQLRLFLNWLKKNEISVVHVHHRRLAAVLNVARLFAKYELIYTGQLTYPYAFWFWLLCPKNVTAISQSVARNLCATTRAKQPELISNSSYFPAECPTLQVEMVKQTAVCVARLEPVKGHQHLIRAWKLLVDRDLRRQLILVGEGSLKSELQAQISEIGLTDLIEFKGFQSNVMQVINHCLFAVLVSEVEGQGIVTIEAAACGRPSLLTDVDGSRDCVPPSPKLPNLVSYGDVIALADDLEIWFENPSHVAEEGKRFYEFLKSNSSIETVSMKYSLLYKHYCKERLQRPVTNQSV